MMVRRSMDLMQGIVVLIFLAHTTGVTSGKTNNGTASTCFRNPDKVLSIDCGKKHMFKVNKQIYGRPNGLDEDSHCGFQEGDCALSDKSGLSCVGQSSCSINLPSGDYGRYIRSCQKHSTYFQVEYECIPESQSVDICSKTRLSAQRGYIHSPRYPYRYPSNQNCELSVVVERSQRIRLYAIDLNIDEGPDKKGCSDQLYYHDKLRGATVCGRRENKLLTTTFSNTLSLEFTSDGQDQEKGFWLYYEAFPLIDEETTTEASTTIKDYKIGQLSSSAAVKPTPNSKLLSSIHPSIQVTDIKKSSKGERMQRHESLPVAAIIGGVLGSLLFILVVLLILLVIKRYRERKPAYSSTELSPPPPTLHMYETACGSGTSYSQKLHHTTA